LFEFVRLLKNWTGFLFEFVRLLKNCTISNWHDICYRNKYLDFRIEWLEICCRIWKSVAGFAELKTGTKLANIIIENLEDKIIFLRKNKTGTKLAYK
jgi:hypothetical protein